MIYEILRCTRPRFASVSTDVRLWRRNPTSKRSNRAELCLCTDYVLATKVFSRTGMGYNDVGASRKHIMDGIEASLKRLQTDYIDLYQIHANDSVTPIEETLYALDTLVKQGKVRYIGVSNWAAWTWDPPT
jgi:aryl-alcohol dehydrogenase-like predicted oxidoreductase